jgi:hypothetical protein
MWGTGTEWNALLTWVNQSKDWSTAVTAIGALIVYQVGWLMNGLTRWLTRRFAKQEMRSVFANVSDEQEMPPVPGKAAENHSPDKKGVGAEQKRTEEVYKRFRAAIYQRGSPRVVDGLALDQSVIRLARGGAVNFFLTAVFLLLLTTPSWSTKVISVLLVILAYCSGRLWWYRNRRYYEGIHSAYYNLPPKDKSTS